MWLEGVASPVPIHQNEHIVNFSAYTRCLQQQTSCYPFHKPANYKIGEYSKKKLDSSHKKTRNLLSHGAASSMKL